MDYTNEFANYKIFKSKEALIQCTHEVGRKNGFVIVIQRSDSGNGGQKARITFGCERSGKYRNTGKNQENRKEKQPGNTVTKKCECPFKLRGCKMDDNDNWILKVVYGLHNHPTTKPLKGRSYEGRLSKEETSLVVDMTNSMLRPSDILARLKNRDANNASKIKQVYNVRQRNKARQRNKVKKMVESSNKTLKSNTFVSFFPVGLRQYIARIKDVEADGNCGFRVIADLMGFGEDGFLRVRKDLLNELNSNWKDYSILYGSPERVEELKNALSYFESSPDFDRWMTMPDMGHLIASAYNVVLFHLSWEQCLTFLPLWSVPIPTDSRNDIAIGFVNNNHFVEVFLSPTHPVPPIAINWYKFHHSCANGWDAVYIPRIEQFKKIISNNVATDEIIDI